MRFGMISEACVSKGMPYSVRYHEVIKEAIFAEEMGLDFFGSSEQHFIPSGYTISAPEVLYGAIAALTSTIKLRHMSVVALKFNHPIRIAERLATLDIISRGRVEFGTARSNNIQYLNTFGVDPTTTRAEWRETLEATLRALMESPFEYHGEHYDFDPVDVVPKLYRHRCPPVFVSSSSYETHHGAGLLGIGAMTFDNWFGWEYVEGCVAEYRKGLEEAKPIGGLYEVNPVSSLLTFPAHCAPTREQAIAESRTTVLGLFNGVGKLYLEMARGEAAAGGTGYSYLHRMEDLDEHKNDIDYMIDKSPSLLIGDPDQCVERCKQLEKVGIDEVILKIDGYGHQANMRSIEMFGKYVIPEFDHPHAIPSNDWEELGVEMERFQT